MRKLFWTLALGTSVCGVTAYAANDKPGRVVTRQSWFTIPFQIEPTQRTDRQPVKVQLHVQDSETGQWRMAEEASPEDGGFQFRAPADGEYSFMVRTFDRAGRQRPQRPPAPELIVVVDTVAPQIELTAARGPAGEVTARWKVSDPELDLESFQLTFQGISEGDGWQQVATPPLEPDISGGMYYGEAVLPVVRLQTGLSLRAEVKDKAGNPAVTQVRVEPAGGIARVRQTSDRQPMIVRPASTSTAWEANPEAQSVGAMMPEEATPGTVAWEADRQASAPYEQEQRLGPQIGAGMRYAADGAPAPSREQLPKVLPAPMQNASSRSVSEMDSAELLPPAPTVGPAGPALGSPTGGPMYRSDAPAPAVEEQYQLPRFQAEVRRPQYRSEGSLPVPDLHAPATGSVSNPGGEPPRMVGSNRFELEYDIESIGPHGIRRVELWGTRDGGLTWKSYGVDDDGRSPLVATVESEGMYGFLISVQSGAGIGGDAPHPGDKPAIWIGVDKTVPSVELIGAQAGAGNEEGCLVVEWKADDAFLAERPVTLLYAEHPGGPWTRIAAGLENNGHYAWYPDRELPEQVFLRLEVRDQAGNVSHADAPEGVSVRLTQPQGRPRNVRPLNGPSARRLTNPYYAR